MTKALYDMSYVRHETRTISEHEKHYWIQQSRSPEKVLTHLLTLPCRMCGMSWSCLTGHAAVSAWRRERNQFELDFWKAMDEGGLPALPQPCFECGMAWDCVSNCISLAAPRNLAAVVDALYLTGPDVITDNRLSEPESVKQPGPVRHDPVKYPAHYQQLKGMEVIDVAEQFNFNRGNALKYICRAGHKSPDTEIQDLEKAVWYLQREIWRLRSE